MDQVHFTDKIKTTRSLKTKKAFTAFAFYRWLGQIAFWSVTAIIEPLNISTVSQRASLVCLMSGSETAAERYVFMCVNWLRVMAYVTFDTRIPKLSQFSKIISSIVL